MTTCRMLLALALLTAAGLAGPDEEVKKVALEERVRQARIQKNETIAIATMRNLVAAQAQFQATARADVDADGVGEYGGFAEMSGGVGVRGTNRVMNPPVLAVAFRKVKDGVFTRKGYRFRVFLMGKKGPVAEKVAGGFDAAALDVDLTEVSWCVYAWPATKGDTGNRAFFVNQWGDILAVADAPYTGAQGPDAMAAYRPKEKNLGGRSALGVPKGQDGFAWKRAG